MDVEVKFGASTSGLVAGVREVRERIEGLTAPVRSVAADIKGIAESVGLAFAAEKIIEFSTEIAEAAERTSNLAASIGVSVEAYSRLAQAMQLVGGDADSAARTFQFLERSMSAALANQASKQADAFYNLGISQEQLKAGLRDLPSFLDVLANAFAKFGGTPEGLVQFREILGRGMSTLVPALKGGADGLHKLYDEAEQTNSVLDKDSAESLEKVAHSVNHLKEALTGLGTTITKELSDPISKAANYLSDIYENLSDFIAMLAENAKGQVHPTQDIEDQIARHEAGALGVRSKAGSSVEDQMRAWMAFAGYSENAIAAILGNAKVESNFNPSITGPGGHFGLFQWDKERAGGLGGSTDVATQMALMDRELQKLDPSFRKATDSVKALTDRFEKIFERSGGQLLKNREVAAAAASGGLSERQVGLAPGMLAAGGGGAAVGTRNSEEIKKDIDEQLKALEQLKKDADSVFVYYERLYKDDLVKVAQVAQQKAEYDAQYVEKRKALLDTLPPYIRKTYQDETNEAWTAATQRLAAEQRVADQTKRIFQQISDQIATAFTDVLARTKSFGAAMLDLLDSLFKDFTHSLISSLLGGTGGAGGGLSSLLFGSQGLSGALGLSNGLFGSLFPSLGSSGLFGALFGGGGGFAGDAASFGLDDIGAAASAGAAAGGGGLFGFLGSLFASAGPAAAVIPFVRGGWVVPSFQDGGILSVLHQREMVLPAHISDGLQSMIASGGGGHTFNLSISALDGASVMRMGPQIVASLNRAMRNGSMLYQPT